MTPPTGGDKALIEGIKSDIDYAKTSPDSCMTIAEGADVCDKKQCIAEKMQQITSKCYIYNVLGPNCNTTWSTVLRECGDKNSYDPPGFQLGRCDVLSEKETCKEAKK